MSHLDSNPEGKYRCENCGEVAHYIKFNESDPSSKKYVCENCASSGSAAAQ